MHLVILGHSFLGYQFSYNLYCQIHFLSFLRHYKAGRSLRIGDGILGFCCRDGEKSDIFQLLLGFCKLRQLRINPGCL